MTQNKLKPLRVQLDVHIPPSVCTNCGRKLDGATVVEESTARRPRKHLPKPGDFTVCIICGHLMCFAEDLTLRDPTEKEIIDVAGDRRVLAIQQARGAVMRDHEEFFDEVAQAISRKRAPGDPGYGETEGLPSGVSGTDGERKDPSGGDDR